MVCTLRLANRGDKRAATITLKQHLTSLSGRPDESSHAFHSFDYPPSPRLSRSASSRQRTKPRVRWKTPAATRRKRFDFDHFASITFVWPALSFLLDFRPRRGFIVGWIVRFIDIFCKIFYLIFIGVYGSPIFFFFFFACPKNSEEIS